jgi:hypothetical protein
MERAGVSLALCILCPLDAGEQRYPLATTGALPLPTWAFAVADVRVARGVPEIVIAIAPDRMQAARVAHSRIVEPRLSKT